MILIEFRPAYGLRLHGAGDRVAWSPGPGSIPGEEPLLPRIETVLGVLAAQQWRRQGGRGGCRGWSDCVLEKAEQLICPGTELECITGPFLLDRASGAVYISVATGLLSLDVLDEYVRAAETLARAAEALLPGKRMKLGRKAMSLLERLRGGALDGRGAGPGLIPWPVLLQRLVGIALAPGRKAVEHGLIYSQAWIDYRAAAEEPAIVLLAKCRGKDAVGEEVFTARLGPRSAPAAIQIRRIEEGVAPSCSWDEPSIVLSPMPLAPYCLGAIKAVHPARPRPPLEQLAKSYSPDGTRFEKTLPEPALWPGTVILSSQGTSHGCTGTANKKIVHALSKEALKDIEDLLG